MTDIASCYINVMQSDTDGARISDGEHIHVCMDVLRSIRAALILNMSKRGVNHPDTFSITTQRSSPKHMFCLMALESEVSQGFLVYLKSTRI